ncbi:hypothetical protein BCT75_24440 [Vibrio lentus]|uniref:hypothetical protein n=1 Tax=Vibrio lentus TaxID=136468 RepID=UPI000C828884|nr:hypothetical protein [Vibrio lentus]PML45976.1 hypothetical protein BCT75_24440 [Vibrio lentus]
MENENNVVKLGLNQEEHKAAKIKFRRLHSAMFGEISSMLRTAKLAPMLELQVHEPSFTAMVEELETYLTFLEQLKAVFTAVNETDVENAREYLSLVKALAMAIESDDHDGLCAAIAALDEKPYI